MQHVYLNKRGMQSIEIEQPVIHVPLKPGEKTTLDIDVINYEAPTHIYLSSRGAIKDKVIFNRNNPYINDEEFLTLTVANPPNHNTFYEGEITISTGYGSKEESFTLQIGRLENEPPLDAIEVDQSLSSMGYRKKTRRSTTSRSSSNVEWPRFRSSSNVGWPRFNLNTARLRSMKNLPYILLALGVIIALILLATRNISSGVVILGLIIVVVLAYYTWRLLD
ncbi:MAG: DUF7524 family protein [Halobacteriota archaeon]